MQTIRIITVGKATSSDIAPLITEYEKRLSKWCNLVWDIVPAAKAGERAKLVGLEGESILSKLTADSYMILLDERGQQFTNGEIANKFEQIASSSKKIVLVIGGAYGVSPEVTQRADLVWSLSKLVFPHQLARLLLAEQLYRTYSILNKSSYHH